jgi:chromosome segregation ATPase
VVENNALKETIKSLESRDDETVATLQKENEELKTKIVELESRESQVEAGVVEALQKENEELKKKNASLCTSESVIVSQKTEVKRLKVQVQNAESTRAHWEGQVRCFEFGMSALTLTGCFQANTLQRVVSDKEKAVQELRNKLAARDSPDGLSAREKQFQTKIEELQRSVEKGEDGARKLRREKLELEEKLKERERQWERAREDLTSSAAVAEARLNGHIKALEERCFEQGVRNAKLAQRNSPEMEQALELSRTRVNTLEQQVRELEAARGEQMGLAPYTVLLRMAECMNQMGKDMREVSRCKVVFTTEL